MSIQLAWKPQSGEQGAADKCFSSAAPASCADHKAALLEAITRGEHLVTLLGMACRIIADATGDPDFLTQARQAVRGLGTAVNHKPTMQERYDGLLEQIRRLQAAQRVEDDPAIRALYQGMITERADWAAQIGAELDAITGGLRFTPPST